MTRGTHFLFSNRKYRMRTGDVSTSVQCKQWQPKLVSLGERASTAASTPAHKLTSMARCSFVFVLDLRSRRSTATVWIALASVLFCYFESSLSYHPVPAFCRRSLEPAKSSQGSVLFSDLKKKKKPPVNAKPSREYPGRPHWLLSVSCL